MTHPLLSDEQVREIWRNTRLSTEEKIEAGARLGAQIERERAAKVAMDHECGGADDIVCQGRNCGMCIAGAIRKGQP
jgi:hypothetical protein